MIKADTREAKLVSVIEVQSSEGAKEAPEAADADNKQRQDAWVKVCVREALGEFWRFISLAVEGERQITDSQSDVVFRRVVPLSQSTSSTLRPTLASPFPCPLLFPPGFSM